MKNDISNHDVPLPDDERFMNAALEEHARLGSLPNDEALIDRILLETVNRKANTVAIASKNSTPWKSLAIGITSAAAGLTVGFFALQSFPLRDSVGQEEEVHFVVRILEDAPTPATAVTKAAPALVARPSESLIEPTYAQVDAVVGSTDASATTFLKPSSENLSPNYLRKHTAITAFSFPQRMSYKRRTRPALMATSSLLMTRGESRRQQPRFPLQGMSEETQKIRPLP